MAKGRQRKATPKKRSASKGPSEAGAHGKYLGHYGWVPDVPDQRDLVFTAARVVTLPPAVDLRPGCPPVYDQGQLGSCTANAIGAAIEYEQIRQKEAKPFAPSRLFIYHNERIMELYFEVFVVGVATIGADVLGLAVASDSSNIFTSASRS